MRKTFFSLIAGERYQVGCTGSVYVLDAAGRELASFRDITHAYYPALHPGGEIAAVYGNTGFMVVYSLSELKLIAKFRVSAAKDVQHDCIPAFSACGQWLYHIEGRKGDMLNSRLTVYSTADWRPVRRLFEQDRKMVFTRIDVDGQTGQVYLLGYFRGERRNEYFVARLGDDALQDVRRLDENTHWFYHTAMGIKQRGFTEQSYKWSSFGLPARVNWEKAHIFGRQYTLDDLKGMELSLHRCWEEASAMKSS